MALEVRNPIPGREYQEGEIIEFVVDPFWEKNKKVRQIQKGEVVSFTKSMVLIRPIGNPWDDPR